MAESRRRFFKTAAWLTAAIELFTILLRFVFRLESTRDTASTIGRITFGIRIHHGYVGVLLAVGAIVLAKRCPRTAWWLGVIGTALIASDLIHHFLVLWPITGSPHFHLVYPS